MHWLNPAAALALAVVAVPLAIHLLLRQRAPRIVVPSVRFIARSDESSLRLRAPSDLLLLLVRAGVVALAAMALMQPLVITAARRSTWANRIVRAIVVDTSESVDASAARVAADAEARDAFAVQRFASADPARAVEMAVAWLNGAPPARRELVVLSDFQLGGLGGARLDRVPRTLGVRAVKIARAAGSATELEAGMLLHENVNVIQHAGLTAGKTEVTLVAGPRRLDGLQVLPGEPRGAVEALVETVSLAGAVAPSAEQPIVMRFRGAAAHDRAEEPFSGWTRGASTRLMTSPAVGELGARVTQRGGALVVDVDASPDSREAAAVLQAALNARRDDRAWTEREPLGIPDEHVSALNREAPLPDTNAWRHAESSDGRWFWLAAILLLGVESVLRRAPMAREREEAARAA